MHDIRNYSFDLFVANLNKFGENFKNVMVVIIKNKFKLRQW